MRAAIRYALANDKESVSLVHKGNIMKFTEGAFRDWGYALAKREFRSEIVSERESWILANAESKPGLGLSEHAKLIEPGYDVAPRDSQLGFEAEVQQALRFTGNAWQRQVQK